MGSGLEDVVLEIVLVEEHFAALGTLVGKLVEAAPVPRIGASEVIEAHSVPCSALAAAAERLLVERCPYIAVGAAYALMVIAAAVKPQTVVVVESHNVFLVHVCECGVYAVGQAEPFASGHESGDVRLCLDCVAWLYLAVPPRHLLASACKRGSVQHYDTVDYVITVFGSPGYARLLHLDVIHCLCAVGRD